MAAAAQSGMVIMGVGLGLGIAELARAAGVNTNGSYYAAAIIAVIALGRFLTW